jgi:NAD(P)-dependent dehydrogenase (short-subunit alcohol dehydrogenase family)
MNIVILGANSDIGSELVRQLAARPDSSVIAVSRSPASQAQELSGVMRLDGCDLLDASSLMRLREAVSHAFTTPFAVVHSVGDFWHHHPLDETSPDVARAQIESHYLTLYNVAHSLVPLMVERGGGQITAFSCNSVAHHYPEMSPFTAAKAAVETLIRCIANEYSGHGIQANYVALPTISTEKVVSSKNLSNELDYLHPGELATFILDDVLTLPLIANGIGLKVFRHNRNFYHSGYFERNPSGRVAPLAAPAR